MADQQLNAVLRLVDQMSGPLKRVGANLEMFSSKAKGVSSGTMGTIAGSAAIAGTALLGLGAIAVQSAGKFERFQSVLTNSLGSSEEASKSMSMLKDIATKTPFALDEITASYIKLVNRGFKPTQEEIVKLGDLASSQGKSFDMLTEAILDAQTGEMERLKEFGVTAQQSGDKVAFTFKGVTTTVEKTDDSIRNYLLSLGDLKGIQGSMIIQSGTYEGMVSNLGDARTNLSATIGEKMLPVTKELIGESTNLLNNINDNIKSVAARGESSNGYVLLVAQAIDSLNIAGKVLPNLGINMTSVANAISYSSSLALGPLGLMHTALKGILDLAGIDIGGAVQNAAQNAVTAKASQVATTIATQNAQLAMLKSSGASIVAPDASKYVDAAKKIQDWQKKINSSVSFSKKSGGGGGSKSTVNLEQEKQIAQEKELLRVAGERIRVIESLGISELKKSQLIVSVNEGVNEELKKIRGDDLQDQQSYYQKMSDKAQEKLNKVKDSFKGMYEAVKTSISKSKDEVDKLTDKIQDSLNKIQGLQDDLKNVGRDTQTSLSDRFVEINKQLAESYKTGFEGGNNAELEEFQKKINDLERERNLIIQTIGKDATDQAMRFDELSPAEKILMLAKEKEDEIRVKIDAEEKLMKEMEEKRVIEKGRLEQYNKDKIDIEKDYTKRFKDVLTERVSDYASYINDMKALDGGSGFNMSTVIGTELDGQRALGGTIQAGRSYLVGENGPEIVSPITTSKVEKVGSLGGATQTNYFTINIAKEVDGEKLIQKMKRELNMDAKLYSNGIS